MKAPARATPSARTSAATDELGAFKGLAYALPLGGLLWALLLWGCAHPSLIALDRAERMGLVRWQAVRPYVRINDAAPWGHTRRVEIDR